MSTILSRAEKQRLWYFKQKKKQIKNLLTYAEEKYKVNVSGDLMNELVLDSMERREMPTIKTIDGIICEWEYWKPYVSEGSFNQFFVYELKNLFRNHASATSSIKCLRSFIGKKAKVVKPLPENCSTSFGLDGAVLLNGKPL